MQKTNRKIIIAGGTGFVGSYLSKRFKEEGFDVIVFSRGDHGVSWNDQPKMIGALQGADCVINLAGRSINCRHTAKNKDAILQSRIATTKALGDAISKCSDPPKLWVNASAAALYIESDDRPNTETDKADGVSFMADVCRQWENAFYAFSSLKTRQIAMRITLILGKDGGVFPVYKKLVRFGLGGKQGSGLQKFSWIHIEDAYRMIRFMMDNASLSGAVNCGSPFPLTNKEVMATLRKQMNIPFGLNAPTWQIKIGAAIIGTESSLILQSTIVKPEKVLKAGFHFQFTKFAEAASDLLI